MRIFILLGHTDKETLSGAFADTYERAARTGGHEVRRMNIGEMQFDPILHKGYKEIQELEPDLKIFLDNVKWCEHIVLIYPVWWFSIPAIVKGLFDRAWLPGFCFKFADHGLTWKKLLKGRTGRIITSANTHPFALYFMYGPVTTDIAHATLGFAGVKTRSTVFGPSERASAKTHARWMRKVAHLGRKGK
jgi:putative NADPH-quinone reductase